MQKDKQPTTPKRGRKIKSDQERNNQINLRISDRELYILDALCSKRRNAGKAWCSRTDIIVLAIKFAAGELEAQIEFQK